MVEVALHGEPDVLLRRARLRAASGRVHEIKARFSVNEQRTTPRRIGWSAEDQVIRVDTTDLDAVDIPEVAEHVRAIIDRG